ncbi:ABC transporter substrate-binding protein [Paraburkholderia caribensis]|uniref:ABC transporter substrate-binding protein n=1 Tax=Paraburkholderia caribensis TaxID=75105 RepID=UPI000CD011B2|nr:ABC transporter substrate-binding protein [Paraburkholderia caribensis]AUT57888.1 ABC transporter substrate-binding protein [Paraburkholderia caribensis]
MKEECISTSRREFIAAASALSVAPFFVKTAKAASKQLMVRTSGGAYDEVKRATVYEPFRQETGIEIVTVPATAGKMMAMFRAGQGGLDVIDIGNDALLILNRMGVLQPIDYSRFKYTDVNDIDPSLRLSYQVANYLYANVMCYNTSIYKPGTEPQSVKDFWNVKRFPGTRTLPGIEAGTLSLDMALLADGVPKDKIYPIDIPRAFQSMSRIRPTIKKFWDSGALSTQMIASGDAALGVLWSTRAQVAIDAGAPIAMQWNDNEVLVQAYGIAKSSTNVEAANKFIDYSLSPVVQARWLNKYKAVPANRRAWTQMPASLIDPKTGQPWTASRGHVHNIEWWADNMAKVTQYWSDWVIT